ncbi:MAG: 50S ribosomal protein L25, partial [Candidatus Saccharimonadales bacterium]
MSNDDIKISAKKREVLGKQVRQLRNDGQTPAVIHERGKDSLHVVVNEREFKKVFSAAGKHHAIKVDVDGKKFTTLLKDVVFAPARTDILHIVFQAIKEDEKVTAELPIKLSGEIPAERANLLVLRSQDHINVEALPNDLIDSIEVDASSLVEVGDKLHVSDIKLPGNIELKTDPELVIATVEMPKDQIAEADAALEEQKAAEGAIAEGEEGEGETAEADGGEGAAEGEGNKEGEK